MISTSINISIHELCEVEKIENELILEIVEYGIVKPIEEAEYQDWVFDVSHVCWIKKAIRLHQDLEIDWVAVGLVIDLMQQKEDLLKQNERYQQQLSRFIE
jgi:chaperone modulatory protein CbpM